MKKYFTNRKGLTLIELLIAIALLGAVMIIASSMLVQSLNVIEPSTRRMSSSQLAELTKREVATILRTAVEFTEINDGYEYKFKAYEPSQEDFSNYKDFILNFAENEQTLKLNERVISHNVTGFSIDNSKSDSFRHVFDIEIEITNEDGNVAVKSTTVRSRNIRLDED